MCSNTWVIALTPLQLMHIKRVFDELGGLDVGVLFYDGSTISAQDVYGFGAEHVVLPPNLFRRKELLRRPCSTARLYRKKIKEFMALVINLIENLQDPVSVYCGSDKNIYTQTIVRCLLARKKFHSLIAVDEGAGYYRRASRGRLAMQVAYRLFARFILGVPYDYVDVLGTWKPVSVVWVRWPELLPFRRRGVIYHKLPSVTQASPLKSCHERKRVLVLSSPLSGDSVLSHRGEMTVFRELIEGLLAAGFEVTVKLHPRDDKQKFQTLARELTFLQISGDVLAENINYWDYTFVVNFGSSAVLSMLDYGYPPDRIFTLDFLRISDSIPLYSLTQVCRTTEQVLQLVKVFSL